MLFNIADDPHETTDLAADEPALVSEAAGLLSDWTEEQVARGIGGITDDPMDIVLDEGGPLHVRGHLPAYLDRLRETGRSQWADTLVERFPDDAQPKA